MKKLSKMKKYINLLLLFILTGFISCENFMEPRPENTLTEELLLENMAYAEGLLLRGYISLPNYYDFSLDIASDDATTNYRESSYLRMASGEWQSAFNPISQWTTAYTQIFYINKFLEVYETVRWAVDPRYTPQENEYKNELYKKRLKGEALALRGWYKYQLLQYHGGKNADGALLGFPIVDNVINLEDDLYLPRNTFSECVSSIFADLDAAIAELPETWTDKPSGENTPPENVHYNITTGARYVNRINGNIARAIKARVALLAASPAFSDASGVTWAQAATTAGELLKEMGELYYKNSSVNCHTFYKEESNKEIIWNHARRQIRSWEQDNFPPSLFGNGRTNPSQNLIDAFPMKNGYPIDHPDGLYNPDNPYANRDSRFYEYIIYNNASLKGESIKTDVDADMDGINVLNSSTRTGYYVKKFMNEGVNLNPKNLTDATHTYVLLRMTELLLNYAEAANEAWGPEGDPNGLGFTAKSKMAELRSQAGIDADPYLASIASKEDLRKLIRNERRISLCFEGFRFWDIRRWNDVSAMQTGVKAAFISIEDENPDFEYREIEERKYEPYMIYGPIPYDETLKYSLDQNMGW